jgi:hypothetical protein
MSGVDTSTTRDHPSLTGESAAEAAEAAEAAGVRGVAGVAGDVAGVTVVGVAVWKILTVTPPLVVRVRTWVKGPSPANSDGTEATPDVAPGTGAMASAPAGPRPLPAAGVAAPVATTDLLELL